MTDEPSSVFPDPRGERRADERHHRPRTTEEIINHAHHEVDLYTWGLNEDKRDLCYLCAPGGYVLRRGASTYVHENQRNPDTHMRNKRWAVVQWFKLQGLPVPHWPEAYRESRDGHLWCHICRLPAGYYGQEDGEDHDALHDRMIQIVMRPSRLEPQSKPKRRTLAPGGNHFLDSILKAREQPSEDQTPTRAPTSRPDPMSRFIPDRHQPGHMRQPTGMEQYIREGRANRGRFVYLNEGELRDLKEVWPEAADAPGQHIPDHIMYTPIPPRDFLPNGQPLDVPKTVACGILAACSNIPESNERYAIRCANTQECQCECHGEPITEDLRSS